MALVHHYASAQKRKTMTSLFDNRGLSRNKRPAGPALPLHHFMHETEGQLKSLKKFIQRTKGKVALSLKKNKKNKEQGNRNHFTQVEVIHWESNLLQQHEAANNVMEEWVTSLDPSSTHHSVDSQKLSLLDKTRQHHQIVPHSEYLWSHLDCEEGLNLL